MTSSTPTFVESFLIGGPGLKTSIVNKSKTAGTIFFKL